MKLNRLLITGLIATGLLLLGGAVTPRMGSSANGSESAPICGFDLSAGTSTPCPVIADPAPTPPETVPIPGASLGEPVAPGPTAPNTPGPASTPTCH